MSFYNYALEFESDKSGRAQCYDLNCSYKDLSQVLASVQGVSVAKARGKLEDAIALKKAIPFSKFNKGMGHRSELGGKKGKYPKKEAKLALELLANAIANAKSKGLDEKSLAVLHACAYKQNVFPRYRRFFASSTILGYGKQAVFSSYVTARAEMVVGEKDAKKLVQSPRERAKQNRKAKLEQKKAKAKPGAKESTSAKTEAKKPEEKTAERKIAESKPPEKAVEKKSEDKNAGEKKAEEKIVAKTEAK